MENERAVLERDRDTANEKIAELKKELEKARTELAELDDDAVRVQRELPKAEDEKLQRHGHGLKFVTLRAWPK